MGSLQALGALHDSCLAAGKKKGQQEALLAALRLLLQSLQDPSCPSYSTAVLFEALSQVNGEVRAQSGVTVGLHRLHLACVHIDTVLFCSHWCQSCSVSRSGPLLHVESSL